MLIAGVHAARRGTGYARPDDRAVKALGHVGVTDVITLMGHYTSVAMTLAFYDVPDGATGMTR